MVQLLYCNKTSFCTHVGNGGHGELVVMKWEYIELSTAAANCYDSCSHLSNTKPNEKTTKSAYERRDPEGKRRGNKREKQNMNCLNNILVSSTTMMNIMIVAQAQPGPNQHHAENLILATLLLLSNKYILSTHAVVDSWRTQTHSQTREWLTHKILRESKQGSRSWNTHRAKSHNKLESFPSAFRCWEKRNVPMFV